MRISEILTETKLYENQLINQTFNSMLKQEPSEETKDAIEKLFTEQEINESLASKIITNLVAAGAIFAASNGAGAASWNQLAQCSGELVGISAMILKTSAHPDDVKTANEIAEVGMGMFNLAVKKTGNNAMVDKVASTYMPNVLRMDMNDMKNTIQECMELVTEEMPAAKKSAPAAKTQAKPAAKTQAKPAAKPAAQAPSAPKPAAQAAAPASQTAKKFYAVWDTEDENQAYAVTSNMREKLNDYKSEKIEKNGNQVIVGPFASAEDVKKASANLSKVYFIPYKVVAR